jgi:peptide/nickel transport system permease protein
VGALIGKKVVQLAAVLLVVTFFSFLLIHLLPGDPAATIIPLGTDAQRTQLRKDVGLDKPLVSQYTRWLGKFVRGDFGRYYRQFGGEPVRKRLSQALPVSLQLLVYAEVLALVIAIPLGILAAYRAGTWVDRFLSTGAFASLAIPDFVLALVLIFYLGVKLKWFPVLGYVHFGQSPTEHFKSMFLPAFSLALAQAAVYMRLLRSDMIATLQEDYILMARSQGLPTWRILLRHALRPSSFSLLTVAGISVGTLIGGAIVIEAIFTLPGVGLTIFQAISERQYIAVQACVAVIGCGYVVVNFVVDLLYTALDPRVRHAA